RRPFFLQPGSSFSTRHDQQALLILPSHKIPFTLSYCYCSSSLSPCLSPSLSLSLSICLSPTHEEISLPSTVGDRQIEREREREGERQGEREDEQNRYSRGWVPVSS